jgi:hypothetical protein
MKQIIEDIRRQIVDVWNELRVGPVERQHFKEFSSSTLSLLRGECESERKRERERERERMIVRERGERVSESERERESE